MKKPSRICKIIKNFVFLSKNMEIYARNYLIIASMSHKGNNKNYKQILK